MSELQSVEETSRPAAHPCPYCRRWGTTHILTPKGNQLECIVCGNVYWASDPTGAKSYNPGALGHVALAIKA